MLRCSCNLNKRPAFCAALGICLTIFGLGILLVVLRGYIFVMVLQKNLIIVPGTKMFPNWQEFPFPIYTSMYLFNVTNAGKVQDHGAKPILVEMGPYVFREFRRKKKLRWNVSNGTVTYQQVRTWHFDASLSRGSLDDIVVTPNPPAVALNSIAAKESTFVRGVIHLGLLAIQEELFVAKPVRQVLIEGYTDNLLTSSEGFPSEMVPLRIDKFGYFYPRNGSDYWDGVFNMHTGQGDLSKLGQIAAWNYSKKSFFPGRCGEVRGAGDFFSPAVPDTFIELYSNDLCRPLRLDFEERRDFEGVECNAYAVSPMFFANKTINPDNWCYNPQNEVPSGVLNVSSCRFGVPIIMSQPHFYQADPIFLQGVEGGLEPVRDKHETRFLVEPQSGLPVSVTARFQVNLYLQSIPQIGMFRRLRDQYFPTVWFETKMRLPSQFSWQVYLLANLVRIMAILGYLIIVSALTASVAVTYCYFSKKAEGIANQDSSEESSQDEEETMQERKNKFRKIQAELKT